MKFIDEFLLNREFHPFFFIFIEMKRISVFWLREGRYSSVTNLKNHKIKDETAKETLMYRIVFWTLGEGKGGMIWENGIETCTISYMKRIASPGSMHDTGCTLGRPRGMVWGGRREEGSGWGTHVPVVDSF